jgi:hypothetical protein
MPKKLGCANYTGAQNTRVNTVIIQTIVRKKHIYSYRSYAITLEVGTHL